MKNKKNIKKSKALTIKEDKEFKEMSEQIQKYYDEIIKNQIILGSNIWIESKEEKIIRLEREIKDKQKELYELKFNNKFKEMINDK